MRQSLQQTAIRSIGFEKFKLKWKKYAPWYVFIIIPVIGFFVFTLWPILWTVGKSFFFYEGTETTQRFIGLENFKTLLADKIYWNSWLTTIKFTVFKMAAELPFSLLVALMLNARVKGVGTLRSIYYTPNVLSLVVIGIIFSNLFGYFGYINALLEKFGFIAQEIDWFADANKALAVLVIAGVWETFGVNVMYFLTALANIPKDLYEASSIDGASKFRAFFSITLPMMGPVLRSIILLSLNGTLLTSELMLTVTGGAPAGRTHTVMSYMTQTFIPGFATAEVNIGYGSAVGVINSILFALIGIVYLQMSKKMADNV